MEKIITLIWPSGTWKSTHWKELAKKIWYQFIDFDDDILEKINIKTASDIFSILNIDNTNPIEIVEQTVWHILKVLWNEKFLELEWYLANNLKLENNTVLATSGSLPLIDSSMELLNEKWEIIYLKSNISDLENRIDNMKLDRIVWIPKNIYKLEKDEKLKIYEEIMQKRTNQYEKYSTITYNRKKDTTTKNWFTNLDESKKYQNKYNNIKLNFRQFFKFLKEQWIVQI